VKWAKDKLDNYPKAKRDLGPLLDALSRTSHKAWVSRNYADFQPEPITQIVGGVALLVAGVLNLLGNLVSLRFCDRQAKDDTKPLVERSRSRWLP